MFPLETTGIAAVIFHQHYAKDLELDDYIRGSTLLSSKRCSLDLSLWKLLLNSTVVLIPVLILGSCDREGSFVSKQVGRASGRGIYYWGGLLDSWHLVKLLFLPIQLDNNPSSETTDGCASP